MEAWRLWLQGYPAQAATRMREACELAERLDGPWARAFAWSWTTGTLQFLGDTAQLDRQAREMHRLSAEHGFSLWIAWATFFEGWVAGARANEADGIALMERGLDAWRGPGARIGEPYFLALLSETCLRAGRIDAAGERLAEAHAQVDSSGECWWEAELIGWSRRDEARRLLGGVLETFTEGHDTADLRAAGEQMTRLSSAD